MKRKKRLTKRERKQEAIASLIGRIVSDDDADAEMAFEELTEWFPTLFEIIAEDLKERNPALYAQLKEEGALP